MMRPARAATASPQASTRAPSPPASPARQRLRAAIEAHAEAKAQRERLSHLDWSGEAFSRQREAEDRVAQAARDLAAAERASTERLIDPDAPAPAMTVAEAREQADAAADALAAAKGARAAIRARLPDAEDRERLAREALTRAALDVIRAEGQERALEIARRVAVAQGDVLSQGAAMMWLAANRVIPAVEQHGYNYGRPADPVLRSVHGRLEGLHERWNARTWDPPPADGAQPWRAWLTALQSDADAPMPE